MKWIADGSGAEVVLLVLGAVMFGVLMDVRQEFASHWARAAVAGLAGAVLVTFVSVRKRKQ
jgi:VanZ family protein